MKDRLEKPDLTRWNRAGLARLRYVNGNAITHLETLRQGLTRAFNGNGDLQWPELEAMDGMTATNNEAERLLQQYHGPRRDYLWEIVRSLARSAHVLTEHIDANSNETFLATATEWENLRKLVALLNYRPTPQASASTALALLVNDGIKGTFEKGFAVKTKPDDGSSPVIFETLDDIDVDADLNVLRVKDWDRSSDSLPVSGDVIRFPLLEAIKGSSVGDVGVLDCDGCFVAVTLAGLGTSELELQLHNPAPAWPDQPGLADCTLWLTARSRRSPKMSGQNVVVLPTGSTPVADGSVLMWNAGGNWQAARVIASESARLKLDRTGPDEGTALYLALEAQRNNYVVDEEGHEELRIILPLVADRASGALFRDNLNRIYESAVSTITDTYDYLEEPVYSRLYYTTEDHLLGTVSHATQVSVELSGKAQALATGDLLVIEDHSGAFSASRLEALDAAADSVVLDLAPFPEGAALIHSHFKHQLRPAGFDRNSGSITGADNKITLECLPDSLKPGRSVLVSDGDRAQQALVTMVDREHRRIRLKPPAADFAAWNTLIYGNTVSAGHGETARAKVLGSGDASRSHQSFELKVDDLSFIADAGFSQGVRADIEISVDGPRWRQVDSLDSSGPEDHHYSVFQLASGNVNILFGDGGHGRRLPSGNNNVRASYRRGTGLSGNLATGALVKPLGNHPWIDRFLQPIPASGGNDREGTASLRQNAPASTLALGRAVSLMDFQHLATSQASVWQARAFRPPPDGRRGEIVRVVVLPAGGGELGTLKDDLQTFLQARAAPQVQVDINPWQPLIFSLDVGAAVDSNAFEPELVADAIRARLLETFSLKLRTLGAPLFRSELLAAVESVAGVSNCSVVIHCELVAGDGATASAARIFKAADGSIRRINTRPEQLLHLDDNVSQINITSHEWSL